MAQWPDSYLTLYSAGSPPVVKAADLNGVQREVIRLWKANRGGDFMLADDFNGVALNSTIWKTAASAGVSLVDDSNNGAFGACRLGAGTTTYFALESILYPIGTLDLRLSGRLRPTFASNKTTASNFGFFGSGKTLGFFATVDGSIVAGGTPGWYARVNTGVGPEKVVFLSPKLNAPYALFDIRRENGVITFSIDGVDLYSTAFAGSFANMELFADLLPGPAASDFLFLDYVKLWVARYPIALSVADQSSH
jgi:hypothetical protein